MNKSPVISLPDIMRSARPKAVIEEALVGLLTKRLKELRVIWNASAFRKALANPKLPADLLAKLENLIMVADASNWKISGSLKMELDETVEDIESFNPHFIALLKKRSKGPFITLEEFELKKK